MAGHTHVLETRCNEKEKLLDRFQRLERYIELSCDLDQPCRKIILSVGNTVQIYQFQNHDSHKEGILNIHVNGYCDIIKDIVSCKSCVVREILSNDRNIYKSLQMPLRVKTYTWFKRELIVPHGLTKLTHTVTDTGRLFVFVDGCKVGNYERDSKMDINSHFFISNIYKCIQYIQDKIASSVATITIILPKWTSKKKILISEECSEYNTIHRYVQWVETDSETTKSEDDRYMLEMALGRNSLIVSNDSFSDLREEKSGVWRQVIDNRILKFEIPNGIDEHNANIAAYKEASDQRRRRENVNINTQLTASDIPKVNQHTADENRADVDTEIKIYGTDECKQAEGMQKENSNKVHQFRFTKISDFIFNYYLTGQFEGTTVNSLNNNTQQPKEIPANSPYPDTKQLCLISYKSTDVTLTIDSLKKFMMIRGVKEYAVSDVKFNQEGKVQVVRLTVSEPESSHVQDPEFWPDGVICRVCEGDIKLTKFYLQVSIDNFDENKIRVHLMERQISVKSVISFKNQDNKFCLTLDSNSFQILSPDFWPVGIQCDPWRSKGPGKTCISSTATRNLQRLQKRTGLESSTIYQRDNYFDSAMTTRPGSVQETSEHQQLCSHSVLSTTGRASISDKKSESFGCPISGANSLRSGLKQGDTHPERNARNRRSENGHQRYRSNRQNTEPVSRDFASQNRFECLQDEEN